MIALEKNKPTKKRFKINENVKEGISGYLFILPFLIFYLTFTFYPLLQGFIISFYKWNITGNKVFIGLRNYKDLLSESMFWEALWHTFMYVIISTPIFMLGAFILAIIVEHKGIFSKSFTRSVFFLPNVLAVSIISIIWLYMLQPYTGLVNSILHTIGISQEIYWLTEKNIVWLSIILITFWWNTGYYMILYIAGMQEISDEQYEAAEIDGAKWFQTVIYITIPSLKRIHVLVLFLQVIASFKIFGQVFLITEGGPSGSSRTFIQYIYETGFNRFFIGKASASAFILFLIILAVSIVQFKIMKKVNREA